MFSPVDLDLDVIEAYGINTTTSCIDGWVYKAPEGSSTLITEVATELYRLYRYIICIWFLFFMYLFIYVLLTFIVRLYSTSLRLLFNDFQRN